MLHITSLVTNHSYQIFVKKRHIKALLNIVCTKGGKKEQEKGVTIGEVCHAVCLI